MAFLETYSSGNRTTARAGGGFEALAVFPKVFNVFTFRPSGTAGDGDEAQIAIGSTVSGASSSVLRGMWVVIHPTSDVRADLITNPEGCVQTWARAEVSGGVLTTGLLDYTWSSSDYVSVLSDWRMFANPNRVVDGVVTKNVAEGYRAPLPRVHGITHDIVLATSGSASYSPTPTATAMSSGASISSHLWQSVNESGTVNKSRSTSATPTFTLNTGTHWLLYIPTDSNGNDYVQAVCVEVIEDDFSNLPTLADKARDSITWNYSAGSDGQTRVGGGSTSQSASIVLAEGRSDLYPEQLGFIMGYGWFSDGTEGDLQGDYLRYAGRVTFDANRDPERSVLNCQLIGITEQLQSVNINEMSVRLESSPNAWGELARTSLFDATWFVLSEHVVNAPPIQAFSGATDYRDGFIGINRGSVWNAITNLMARCQSACDVGTAGELRFVQDASIKIDSRTFTSRLDATDEDILNFTWRPHPTGEAMERADVGALSYDTTVNERFITYAVSKSDSVRGVFVRKYDGNILAKDLSESARLEDTGRLAYNFMARDRWTLQLDVEFKGGYGGLLPSRGEVVTLTLASDDSEIQEVLSTSQEWMVVSVSVSVSGDGRQSVRATLELVTGGENRYSVYAIDVTFAPDDLPWLDLLSGEPFPDFDDEFDTPYDNVPEGPKHYPDDSRPEDKQEPTIAPPNNEIFYISLNESGVQASSVYAPAIGEKYNVQIQGAGIIKPSGSQSFDFSIDEQGWSAAVEDGDAAASYSSGNYWNSADIFRDDLGSPRRVCHIEYDFGYPVTIEDGTGFVYDLTTGSPAGNAPYLNVSFLDANDNSIDGEVLSGTAPTGTDVSYTWSGGDVEGVHKVRLRVISSDAAYSGTARIKSATLVGTAKTYSDGIAYWVTRNGERVLHSTGEGLLINGANVALPASNNAFYSATLIGDGAVIPMQFVDPDSFYEHNQGYLIVRFHWKP